MITLHPGRLYYGTAAERTTLDTAEFRVGHSYLESDTGYLYWWSGSAWASRLNYLFSQTANKVIANTTTETTLIGTGVGTVTLPADFLIVGRSIRITARGINSTATPAGTLTFRAKLGGTNVCVSPSNTATNGLTNRGWRVAVDLVCRTVGATGTVRAQGSIYRSTGAGSSATWMLTSTVDTVVDTTGALAVNATAQWGTASASNTMTCTNLTVEVLN